VERVHVYVSGLVQGVAFRWFVRRVARELGVKGWVRNLPDGRVEAVFEGEERAVERLVELCRCGPPAARVDEVKVLREEYKGEFDDFEIVY